MAEAILYAIGTLVGIGFVMLIVFGIINMIENGCGSSGNDDWFDLTGGGSMFYD